MRCTLILASASPRRRQLISVFGLPVIVRPPSVDESVPDHWTPAKTVEELSRRKAEAVLRDLSASRPQAPDEVRVVVGSDTVVVLDGKIMGKPADREDARNMLRRLSGRTHEVYTGVTCIRESDGRALTKHRMTRVTFRPLSDSLIERYIATGEPMDKAGAYGVQGIGAVLIENLEGDFFSVMGLPVGLLFGMLAELEIHPPFDPAAVTV
ncbi:MAG TPA: nucleoside triphosphate pyrophosphatase [Paenibacillaceae bacterium]